MDLQTIRNNKMQSSEAGRPVVFVVLQDRLDACRDFIAQVKLTVSRGFRVPRRPRVFFLLTLPCHVLVVGPCDYRVNMGVCVNFSGRGLAIRASNASAAALISDLIHLFMY
jgi:hypothetical protein